MGEVTISEDKISGNTGTAATVTNHQPMEISLAEASSIFPGFRFSPTDEELIQFYLKKKLEGVEDDVRVIPELDICAHEPWDLPAQSVIKSDDEWFFFSRRGRKYPNGSQNKRATDSGYWKATGKERSVKWGCNVIGSKRTLVFHSGRGPRGRRTEWIMHEYSTSEKSQDSMVVFRLRRNKEFQLSDNARRDDLVSFTGEEVLPGMPDRVEVDDHGRSNPHSVELVDIDSCESPRRYSSGSKMVDENGEEDDCYADIMNDDIVKLDDTSPETRSLSERTPQDHGQNTTSRHPFQGTANQRLRLGRQRTKSRRAKAFERRTFGKESLLSKNVHDSSYGRGAESMIHRFHRPRINLSSIILFLVTLILIVVLLMFLMRDSPQAKKLRDIIRHRWNENRPLVTWQW